MKPMLAANNEAEEVLANLRFPLFASAKLDGIRGFNDGGILLSRNLKEFPNSNLRDTFGWSKYFGYDGEFINGEPTEPKICAKTQSVTSSHDKDVSAVRWHVFDFMDCNPDLPYDKRLERLTGDNLVHVVEQKLITNLDDLLECEDQKLNEGYEGLILRDPKGRYKYGRSTLKEGLLLKLKRFIDDEAVVIGFEEKMHNANEKTLVKNGKPHRSSHASGLVPLGTLGALVVRWRDVEFNIGTGFDHSEAQEIWDNRDKYLGKLCTFKYFNYGIKDAPRHPVFKCWRTDK